MIRIRRICLRDGRSFVRIQRCLLPYGSPSFEYNGVSLAFDDSLFKLSVFTSRLTVLCPYRTALLISRLPATAASPRLGLSFVYAIPMPSQLCVFLCLRDSGVSRSKPSSVRQIRVLVLHSSGFACCSASFFLYKKAEVRTDGNRYYQHW
jgi:hypothetical protein